MADPVRTPPEDPGRRPPFDTEISVKGLLVFGVCLVGAILLALGVTWGVVRSITSRLEASDAPPSPVAAANRRHLPPLPRLQADPPLDLAAWRAHEDGVLDRWAWVDERAGVAQVPIDRALQIALEQGLPHAAPPTPAEVAAEGGEANPAAGEEPADGGDPREAAGDDQDPDGTGGGR